LAIPSLSDNALEVMRLAEDLTSPEDIFLAWLLSLPDGVDPSDAAVAEIVRLDRARFRSPRRKRLRELFVAAAKSAAPKGWLS
jgi:hypothetical protein